MLAGSSGRLDVGRADLLASHGVTALALRWFGAPGQPAMPREVPLETITDAVTRLAAEVDRVVVLGLSYGAEAALLAAVRDRRIAAVVAFAPTDVAWEGQHEHDDDPQHSKWTWGGKPVPFVPLDRGWEPPDPPAFVEHYRRSRRAAGKAAVRAAAIPVEHIAGEVVLVVGGDDQVWDSSAAARAITARRSGAGLGTAVVEDPAAGHSVVLPGEAAPDASRPYLLGGDEGAAERLGLLAWPYVARVLRIRASGE